MCQEHRSTKCFRYSEYGPAPNVCIICEPKVMRVSVISCLAPAIIFLVVLAAAMIMYIIRGGKSGSSQV